MSGENASHDSGALEPRAAVYVMSVAAELVGTHPQTLRDYERRGLISPSRTTGGNRRYTQSDIEKVLRIKKLRDEGMSLTAIVALMEYEEAIEVLQHENDELKHELAKTQHRLGNVENRLHEVESNIGSTEIVKRTSRDVVLVVHPHEGDEDA
jgi:MerR family transcriptional regulator/heat shock protein HspR